MFSTRVIRPTRVRSLITDGNCLLSCKLHRNHVTISNLQPGPCKHRSSDLTSPVRKPIINKCVRTYGTETGSKCWNCDKNVEIANFSCANCGVLQRPDERMTYFQIMSLPENFDLDLDDISSKYKSLQKMFHPDKFVQKSQEEIDISDYYSRLVNKAYSTLKNPLSRGMYILNLNGLPTDDDVKMKQEFLMEILEKNEEVENLSDAKALQEFEEVNSKIISDYISMASKAFQKNDLQEARQVLMKMKYFVNIDNELKKKKSAMGIVN